MFFDIQRFVTDYVRDTEETTYRGRRRIAGNYGRVYVQSDTDGAMTTDASGTTFDLIFEIKAFEAKITAEREDVWIGISKDSKVVGYSGEGEITIVQVFDRGYSTWVEAAQKGHDIRFTLIGDLSDPDQLGHSSDRIKIANVWINELEIMKFEKGGIVEKTIPFGFTPQDVYYSSAMERTASTTTSTVSSGATEA